MYTIPKWRCCMILFNCDKVNTVRKSIESERSESIGNAGVVC